MAMLIIGLMSGTSLDGVDAVLARCTPAGGSGPAIHPHDPAASATAPGTDSAPAHAIQTLAHASLPLPTGLHDELLALNRPGGHDELHRAALAANALARLYAEACHSLLAQTGLTAARIHAIGAHGQTVRHRPGAQAGSLADPTGYTLQLNNPALLAELTGIAVVADFRSRDIAAGGQGAPLVPAFHQQVFGLPGTDTAVLNLGGIANLTLLPADGEPVLGFDTGPANALMDAWTQRHTGRPYDAGGQWAASGQVHAGLLQALAAEPFFRQPPPKSTGRDLFHDAWLQPHLSAFQGLAPADVQATLLELTAYTATQALARHLPACRRLLVCGGGALNTQLMLRLDAQLEAAGVAARVQSTADCGLPPTQVEAAAFAWLAACTLAGLPGNLPSATGAAGPRILGALYPA